MDRYLLKNSIILILVLVNVFLLGSLGLRRGAALSARERTENQLVALFAADGMELDESLITWRTPPAALSMARDSAREREAAVFFLGDSAALSSEDGGVSRYTALKGAAQFRANGSFDIAGSLSGEDQGQELCRTFCKRFSFDGPEFSLDNEGSGTGSAVFRLGKLPVYNCTVTFTLDRGALMTVSGTLLPLEGASLGDSRTPLSAAAALTAFQQLRRESYAVVSAVTELSLCYELQASAASPTVTLAPAWQITTDTGKYYVNCITGAVTV